MENLKLDDTKGESSQASDLPSESYAHNHDTGDIIPDEWRKLGVSYSDIRDITDNFNEILVIGEGGFGKVYQAKLDGRQVAIKILDSTSKQGKREFLKEIEVLHKMRHPNLVKLLGACFEVVYALVYEYLPNGSLEDRLEDHPEILTWQMRTRIIYEICLALSYLHSESMVHSDLKPANILLDASFKSKLADFGLCRFLPKNMMTSQFLETKPSGTLAYMDPWYLQRGLLRPGSDLYSLGITVLKVLTRKSPVGLAWTIRETNKNLLRKMIDPTAGNWPFELAKEMVHWSLQCCFHNENSSKVLMDMSTCLKRMLADIDAFQEPEQTIELASNKEDKKEVMAATNYPSSSSFSEPEPPTKDRLRAPKSTTLKVDTQPKPPAQDGLSTPEPSAPKVDTQVDKPRGDAAGGKLVHFEGSLEFELDDLLRAGTSGDGKLYKASLKDGNEVVVKRFKEETVMGKRFEEELNVLGKIRHANLLAVRGYYCNPNGEKLLVFDSMAKGSLATFLHDRGPGYTRFDPEVVEQMISEALANGTLDTFLQSRAGPGVGQIKWLTRINIAIGIARGLYYLHNDMNIIHGNLTSANILLDDKNNAKISDYELSRLMTKAAFSDVTATATALGYRKSFDSIADPRTDVYSLGVIILELLTGTPPRGVWTASTATVASIRSVLDPELNYNYQVSSTIELALKCVHLDRGARPDVQQVLQKLRKIKPEKARQ